MTRSFSRRVPTPEVAGYYARRAEGEVGLIISEGTVIDRPASSNDRAPPLPRRSVARGLAGRDRPVHAAGGRMAPQLWHMGVAPPGKSGWLPSGPFEGPRAWLRRAGSAAWR